MIKSTRRYAFIIVKDPTTQCMNSWHVLMHVYILLDKDEVIKQIVSGIVARTQLAPPDSQANCQAVTTTLLS